MEQVPNLIKLLDLITTTLGYLIRSCQTKTIFDLFPLAWYRFGILGMPSTQANINLDGNGHQCDQMARFFIQKWSFYVNEALPNGIQNYQSRTQILLNIKLFSKILPKASKIMPKWRNVRQIWSLWIGHPLPISFLHFYLFVQLSIFPFLSLCSIPSVSLSFSIFFFVSISSTMELQTCISIHVWSSMLIHACVAYFWGLCYVINTTVYHLGWCEPLSPSFEELHASL